MFNIITIGSGSYANFISKMLKSKNVEHNVDSIFVCQELNFRALNPDMVIFTGGEDVDPSMYGHDKHYTTTSMISRDKMEKQILRGCLSNNVLMVGICRGSQFLWTMGGGKLFQDVENHGRHHSVFDFTLNTNYMVNSTHHQMANVFYKPENTEILAVSDPNLSNYHVTYNSNSGGFDSVEHVVEIEAWIDRKSKILGIQWHPEMTSCPTEGKNLAMRYVEELIKCKE